MLLNLSCVSFRIAVFLIWSGARAEEEPTVRVRQGVLRGKEGTSVLGKQFFSFQGIPYAEPPIAGLRFKDARPGQPWVGVWNATEPGSICTQLDASSSEVIGSEDCLYLNVYTPQLPMNYSQALPVMFWIHGGGFTTGSGVDTVYGPDYLLSDDIVLVTINYRLVCFGFLFLQDAAPGNVGLKDQVAALRWVKDNIAAFNGDPDKVTIFGESAGAVSVSWHMQSPMTRGLFHGAIAQSGSCMNPWATQWEPYETSLRLARAVGCSNGSDDDIVDCLLFVDAATLCKAAISDAPTQKSRQRLMTFPFVPTVEEVVAEGVERFLLGPAEQQLKQGLLHDVPFLTGINDAEWTVIDAINSTTFNDENLHVLDSDWDTYVLSETRLPGYVNSSTKTEAIEEIRNFYLDGKNLTSENVQGYKNMITDLEFTQSMFYEIKHISESNKAHTYLYSFTVDQQLNFLKNELNWSMPDACHADDLGYLFHVQALPEVSPTDPAYVSRARMVRLWTNFAKTGNPTPSDDPLIGLMWKPYTTSTPNYFEIGNNLTSGTDLYADRIEFWENFYKEYNIDQENNGWFIKSCPWSIVACILMLSLIHCIFNYEQ